MPATLGGSKVVHESTKCCRRGLRYLCCCGCGFSKTGRKLREELGFHVRVGIVSFRYLSLSLSLTHTQAHTHTHTLGVTLVAVTVKVGKLKCIVRVTKGNPDDEPLFVDKRNFPTLAKAKARNDVIMAELLKVRCCCCCCCCWLLWLWRWWWSVVKARSNSQIWQTGVAKTT